MESLLPEHLKLHQVTLRRVVELNQEGDKLAREAQAKLDQATGLLTFWQNFIAGEYGLDASSGDGLGFDGSITRAPRDKGASAPNEAAPEGASEPAS